MKNGKELSEVEGENILVECISNSCVCKRSKNKCRMKVSMPLN